MIAGLFTPQFLMKERKLHFKNRPSGYFGFGTNWAWIPAGWTPCSGPIIGAIIGLAAANQGSGMYCICYYMSLVLRFRSSSYRSS